MTSPRQKGQTMICRAHGVHRVWPQGCSATTALLSLHILQVMVTGSRRHGGSIGAGTGPSKSMTPASSAYPRIRLQSSLSGVNICLRNSRQMVGVRRSTNPSSRSASVRKYTSISSRDARRTTHSRRRATANGEVHSTAGPPWLLKS